VSWNPGIPRTSPTRYLEGMYFKPWASRSGEEGITDFEAPRALPPLRADLVLMHAPAVFDFRERGDIYYPFLSTSGDIPITPMYEVYPLGFKSLQQHLGAHGREVKIVNLASLLLRYRHADFRILAESIDARLVGIDLHWMVHAQGALGLAAALRRLRPDLTVVFGGISASYYAKELIRHPAVDLVMRGYDTLAPMTSLLDELSGDRELSRVPNLLWKSPDGRVHDNGMVHLPRALGCGVDWSTRTDGDGRSLLSVSELLSNQNTGCRNSCGWCGGSSDAFRRIYGTTAGVVHRSPRDVESELGTLRDASGAAKHHLYALGAYNSGGSRLKFLLDRVAASGVKSVNFEQFSLPPDHVVRAMVAASRRSSITLSPESHDLRVAKLAGRGVYTNQEMEAWIDRALELGIQRVDVWYFVGMPEQDADSVHRTVDYAVRLMERFKGRAVVPMICPMLPILDPACEFFERPAAHGYRVFNRTISEHCDAALRPSLINRINYETRWLSRSELVHVGFGAVRALMQAKAAVGMFSGPRADLFNGRLTDALDFLDEVHLADEITDPAARRRALQALEEGIARRNEASLYGGTLDQTYPLVRPIGGRWYDDLGWAAEDLEHAFGARTTVGAASSRSLVAAR
jgi:clorobiocin/coumermycin A biosynthesis protein CloN6/CouN6